MSGLFFSHDQPRAAAVAALQGLALSAEQRCAAVDATALADGATLAARGECSTLGHLDGVAVLTMKDGSWGTALRVESEALRWDEFVLSGWVEYTPLACGSIRIADDLHVEVAQELRTSIEPERAALESDASLFEQYLPLMGVELLGDEPSSDGRTFRLVDENNCAVMPSGQPEPCCERDGDGARAGSSDVRVALALRPSHIGVNPPSFL